MLKRAHCLLAHAPHLCMASVQSRVAVLLFYFVSANIASGLETKRYIKRGFRYLKSGVARYAD